MKKILYVFILTICLVGCDKTTKKTTAITTIASTTTTIISTSFLPVILTTPENLVILPGTILSWNKVEGAQKYIVTVNGVEHEVTTNYFDLTSLPDNNYYTVTVKAVNDNGQSLNSVEIDYSNFESANESLTVLYSIYLDSDFTVDMYSVSEIYDIQYSNDEDMIHHENWSFSDHILTIKESYLDTINQGTPLLLLYTSNGIIEMNVVFSDINEPYPVKGQTYIQNSYQDVYIRFEMMGAEFKSVSFQGLDNTNYRFENNTLIIYANFLDNLFILNPDRNVIIGYNFELGDDSIIGVIIIHR